MESQESVDIEDLLKIDAQRYLKELAKEFDGSEDRALVELVCSHRTQRQREFTRLLCSEEE